MRLLHSHLTSFWTKRQWNKEGVEGSEIEKTPLSAQISGEKKGSTVEVQLPHTLQLRLASSLALTAENWEPCPIKCILATQGMVRLMANNKPKP